MLFPLAFAREQWPDIVFEKLDVFRRDFVGGSHAGTQTDNERESDRERSRESLEKHPCFANSGKPASRGQISMILIQASHHRTKFVEFNPIPASQNHNCYGSRNTCSFRHPWAPSTNDCSMSAVLLGPDTKMPNPGWGVPTRP